MDGEDVVVTGTRDHSWALSVQLDDVWHMPGANYISLETYQDARDFYDIEYGGNPIAAAMAEHPFLNPTGSYSTLDYLRRLPSPVFAPLGSDRIPSAPQYWMPHEQLSPWERAGAYVDAVGHGIASGLLGLGAGASVPADTGGIPVVLTVGLATLSAYEGNKAVQAWRQARSGFRESTPLANAVGSRLQVAPENIDRYSDVAAGVVYLGLGKGPAAETTPELLQVGGAYRDVKGIPGYEAHHMPADSISPLSTGEGPSIAMPVDDHRLTASWGNSRAARAYRQTQADLIAQGDFRGAQQLDINDINTKFGNKYDDAIQQMLKYSQSKGH